MKREYLKLAQLIHDKLCIGSSHLLSSGQIVCADYVVAIGDDVLASLWATYMYYAIKEEYKKSPHIVCVGENSLLSRCVYGGVSESVRLSMQFKLFGVPYADFVTFDGNRDIIDNVKIVRDYINQNCNETGPSVLWVVPQRYSLRLERTVGKQANDFQSRYYVIKGKIDSGDEQDDLGNLRILRLYNYMGLCDGMPLLQELASILPSCRLYSYNDQLPISGDMVTDDVFRASEMLADKFGGRCPDRVWTPSDALQKLKILIFGFLNRKKIQDDRATVIGYMSELLREQGLVLSYPNPRDVIGI